MNREQKQRLAFCNKMRLLIIKNWFWFMLGSMLQMKAIELAKLERGFEAIGGEWLVLPVVLMIVGIAKEVWRGATGALREKELGDDTAVMEDCG